MRKFKGVLQRLISLLLLLLFLPRPALSLSFSSSVLKNNSGMSPEDVLKMSLELVEEQDGAIISLLNEKQLLRQQTQLLNESLTSEINSNKRLKVWIVMLAVISALSIPGWVLFGIAQTR